jgi:hypothetical protein
MSNDEIPQSLLQQIYFLFQHHCLLLWVLVKYGQALNFCQSVLYDRCVTDMWPDNPTCKPHM